MARRKKRAEWHHENLDRWLLTYSDMITLLMLFFVVLYSMSTINEQQYKQLSETLGSILNGGNFTIFADQTPGGGRGLLPGAQQAQPSKPAQSGKTTGAGGSSSYLDRARSDLQSFIKSGSVKVIPTERGFSISLMADVGFASGSADVGQEALPILEQIAAFLVLIPNAVVVEGYTDNSPVAGTKWDSNFELSAERAVSVLSILQAYGVPAGRLSAAAFGDTRPVAANDTPEGRAANRRVDITIVEQ